MDIRPQDLPEIRADVIDWINGPDAAAIWRKAVATGYLDWLFGDRAMGCEDASVLRGTEINRLREASLFHVSAEMVDVACAAARTIPDFQLAHEDLPTTAGLMVFDKPPCVTPHLGGAHPVGVKAVCWAPIPNGHNNTLFGSIYLDREEAAPLIASMTVNRRPYTEPKLIFAHGGEFVWTFGQNEGKSPDPSSFLAPLAPILRSTWLLMQQPLTHESQAEPNRASVKRLRRAGHEPTPVRVIELRRPKTAPGAPSESGREYHHQWIVRGHWRQQWFPKRQVHRPVWIAPHIKGPEGAPLIGGEKVYALKR